jgi:hypothetical protein
MKKLTGIMLGLLFCLALCVPAMAAGHTVTLSCTLPADWLTGDGINFYRGTAAGAEGITAINSTPATTCAYTDSNVVAGQTYYYVGTHLANGKESVKSNEANATVLPFAPSGMTAVAN